MLQQTLASGRNRLALLAAAGLLVTVMAGGGLAWGIAQAQSPSPTIYACVAPAGSVRIVAEGEECRGNETLTSWSQEGPQGPVGAQGPEGPKGDTGDVEVTVQLDDDGTAVPSAPVNMFLKIGGIAGEATNKEHVGEIEVLAWAWGMSSSGTTHVGSGGGSGTANIQDISITKWVDKSSPYLQEALLTSTHIPDAVLTVRQQTGDGEGNTYLVITLEDIIVTSVSFGGSNGEDRLTENVTLNFAKVKVEYTKQNADGSSGETHVVTRDIVANTP